MSQRPIRWRRWAAVGLLAGVGCQTTPPAIPVHRPPAANPQRPTPGVDAAVVPASATEPVVTTATPPAVPPAERYPVDLPTALRLAGVENPTIGLADEVVRESLADLLAARSLLLPSVNLGGNYHLHRGNLQASTGLIRDVDSQSLYLGAGARTVAAESVAFPGVRLFAHLGDAVYEPLAARQRVTERQGEAVATRNATLLAVATAFLELAGAEARVGLLRLAEGDLAEVVRLTVAYAQAGQGREADADRARGNADLLARDRLAAEEDAAVAAARLAQLLNLDPAVRLSPPGGPVEPVRLLAVPPDPRPLVEAALRGRPEVLAASAAVSEAQTRRRQEATRPFLPLVSVGVSGGAFGGGSNLVANSFGPLRGRTDFDVFAVWDIENFGFGTRARVRRADAGIGQAVAAYDGTLNLIRRQVAEAHTEVLAAARQYDIATAAVATAEEGYRLDFDRIKQGEGLPLEVLDTFRQRLDTRLERVRATVAFNVAQFRLFVAVGQTPTANPP